MEIIEKVVEKDHEKYAKKSTANTALGLAIAGTGLWALNGGLGNLGLFGNNASASNRSELDALASKECQDVLDLTKFIYEQRIDINNTRFEDRNALNAELFGIYKGQVDADFQLYKGQRDGFDVLSERISKLETSNAVNAAIEPWRAKVLEMQIYGVDSNAKAAVALEAERRYCADTKIVNYVNSTFSPQHIAAGTPDTKNIYGAPIYNPLCPCPTLV